MIQGIVETRFSQVIPFKTEMIINFQRDTGHSINVKIKDILAGSIQFKISLTKNYFSDGDRIQLLFDLPFYGKTTVEAEISFIRFGIDLNQERIVYCNAKLVDVTMEIWNAIMDYYQTTLSVSIPNEITYHQERNDIRVNAGKISKLFLESGHHCSCQIEDISFGGAKLRLRGSFPVKTPIKLLITDSQQPFVLEGVSVWKKSTKKENEYFIGIMFNQLNVKQFNVLRAYIYRLAARQDSAHAS